MMRIIWILFAIISLPGWGCINTLPESEVLKAIAKTPGAGAKRCSDLPDEKCYCYDGIDWDVAELVTMGAVKPSGRMSTASATTTDKILQNNQQKLAEKMQNPPPVLDDSLTKPLNITDINNYMTSTIMPVINGKANTSHTHVVSDITGLASALDSKIDSLDGTKRAFKLLTGTINSSTGEVTVYPTATGSSGGAAIFSSIAIPLAIAYDSSGNIVAGSFAVVKSEGTTSITLKFIRGKNQAVLVAGAFDTTQNSGALTVKALVLGTKI